MSATARSPKYVYGVLPGAASAPRGTGILRRPLYTIAAGELAALVSDAPDGEIGAGSDDLMTHARVVERAHERTAVLPMRFGVVMPGEDAIREELLEDHHDDLLAQLHELDGKAELRLRAVYNEQALLSEILQANPKIAQLNAAVQGKPADASYYERIELGQRVAQEIELLAAADRDAIVAALEPLAVAVRAEQPEHERVAANIAFLVEQRGIPAFDAAVDDLGRRSVGRMDFKYTGPLPPYSFVELSGQV
jgi:hypothetical protein